MRYSVISYIKILYDKLIIYIFYNICYNRIAILKLVEIVTIIQN